MRTTDTHGHGRIRLKPGQSLRLHAVAGTSFVAMQGRVSITEAPVWLCEQFLNRQCGLRDGEQYVIQRSGWVAVNAHEAAEFMCIQAHEELGMNANLRLFASALLERMRQLFSRRWSWK